MILLDILDVLNELGEEQRDLVLGGLLEQLTNYSHYAILEAQLAWDGSKPYRDFVNYQNEIIVECIKAEMTRLGAVIRRTENLAPLTLRTEVYL